MTKNNVNLKDSKGFNITNDYYCIFFYLRALIQATEAVTFQLWSLGAVLLQLWSSANFKNILFIIIQCFVNSKNSFFPRKKKNFTKKSSIYQNLCSNTYLVFLRYLSVDTSIALFKRLLFLETYKMKFLE